MLEVEDRERDDVFRKAFRKNRDDFLDGLLLLEGKSGFGGGRFTHHAPDKDKKKDQEQDLEIIEELNGETNNGAETGEEDEAETTEEKEDPEHSEPTKRRYSSEIKIARVSNDLDNSDEEEGSDEGLEEHEKEISQQEAAGDIRAAETDAEPAEESSEPGTAA